MTTHKVYKNDRERILGYLKSALILMMIAFHSVLAYMPFIPAPSPVFNDELRIWRVFPVLDTDRWGGFFLYMGFFDTFVMALMFFLSGLFVYQSLRRKRRVIYLRDRFVRLGIPFIVFALIAAPAAYYPSYILTGADPSLVSYIRIWVSQSDWPSGHLWFIWLLLFFNCAAVPVFSLLQTKRVSVGSALSQMFTKPAVLFIIFFMILSAAYLPMLFIYGPKYWTSFGPFSFQTSRLLFYGLYFLAGCIIGVVDPEYRIFSFDGRLAKRWLYLSVSGLAVFLIYGIVFAYASKQQVLSSAVFSAAALSFVLCGMLLCYSFVALFIRFSRRSSRFFNSLQDNAYGMYLVHYVIVSWMQYLLIHVRVPGVLKGGLVFFIAVVLSWTLVSFLRRIPVVARIL